MSLLKFSSSSDALSSGVMKPARAPPPPRLGRRLSSTKTFQKPSKRRGRLRIGWLRKVRRLRPQSPEVRTLVRSQVGRSRTRGAPKGAVSLLRTPVPPPTCRALPAAPSKLPGARLCTVQLSAKLLAVGEPRAKVIRQMASLLSAVSLSEVTRVAQDLLTWRRKDNRSILKPTTQLTYFTALIVAATTLSGIPFGRDPVIHRIEKSIKAAQLLHVRRQALPLGWEDLLAILSDSRISPDLSWQKGPDGPLLLVRCRGFKGQCPGARSYWRFLAVKGQPYSFVKFLLEASAARGTEPVFTASWAVVVAALRTRQPHYTAHSIRRGVATFLADRGFSITAIRDHLGHATVKSTRQYVIPRAGQADVIRRAKISLGAWRPLG